MKRIRLKKITMRLLEELLGGSIYCIEYKTQVYGLKIHIYEEKKEEVQKELPVFAQFLIQKAVEKNVQVVEEKAKHKIEVKKKMYNQKQKKIF